MAKVGLSDILFVGILGGTNNRTYSKLHSRNPVTRYYYYAIPCHINR